MHRFARTALVVMAAACGCAGTILAADAPPASQPAKKELRFTPGDKYRAHDMNRPRPAVVDPGTPSTLDQPGRPPADAIILFDGKDLAKWQRQPRKGDVDPSDAPKWKIENGYAEIAPKSGAIISRDKFGDCQFHIEWATPTEVVGNSQGRGNSGVILQGVGEIQVLDSCNNDTYPDGQAAAIYGKYPPLVNASRGPGAWQMYDIIFESAKTDAKGQNVPARLTVLHNGVVVHHAVDPLSKAREFQLVLQDHNNPIRYRNIWLRPLKGYDEGGTPAPASEEKK